MGSKLIRDIVLLYVEDEEEIRTIYERFLRRRVENILVANNGKEGFDIYKKQKPDLIITDINMPIMNGLEMCSLIRDDNIDIPIIVTSAHSEAQYFQEAINIGINMFLLKPVDMTQLYNTIKIASENIYLKAENKEDKNLVSKKTAELEKSNEELQRSIENLKTTQDKLVKAENMASLGVLSAGIAHEINTPVGIGLTGITHFHEITKEIKAKYHLHDMTEDEFEEYLETADELAGMINANLVKTAQIVKSFKQVSMDQTSEVKRSFNITKYLREVLLSLNNVIKKSKLIFNIEIDEKLEINSYPGAFSQVITNLVVNSINHAYEKEEKGTITICVEVVEEEVKLMYKDDGKGISPENLPKIFDLFFTTNSKHGGTGLGLNIVQNIITKNLCGTIECLSVLNEGTVFNIVLPLK